MSQFAQTHFWSPSFPQDPRSVLVLTPGDLERCVNELRGSNHLAFDFETDGFDWHKGRLGCGLALGYALGGGQCRAFYLPYRHQTGESQLEPEMVQWAVKPLLANPDTLKIAHNIKFDEHFARREGWTVEGPRYCTMIAAGLWNENIPAALKTRAQTDLGVESSKLTEDRVKDCVRVAAKEQRISPSQLTARSGYAVVPIPVLGYYACHDILYTLQLWEKYEGAGLSSKLTQVWPLEMELTRVLHDIEEAGLVVDTEYLDRLSSRVIADCDRLATQIPWRVNGSPVLLSSDKQVLDYLLGTLRLPLTETTKKGQLSVGAEALAPFAQYDPAIPLFLDWRAAMHTLTAHCEGVRSRLGHDGRLHADFQQAVATTGRLSCRNPNLQNFSSDDDDRAVEESGLHLSQGGADPYSVRRMFPVEDSGSVRLFFDYSQVELRVLAFYTRDPILQETYKNGGDIHARTSLEVFGSADKVYRRPSKVLNFGTVYCMGPDSFGRKAGMSSEEAARHMSKFFAQYRGITTFREQFWERCRKRGGNFSNMFGRPRRLPDLLSSVMKLRTRAERQAFGTLIQGTAAHITKAALVRLWKVQKSGELPIVLRNTIHDDVQMDTQREALSLVVPKVRQVMEDFPEFQPIPIIVDGEFTVTNWAEKAHLPLS